MFHAAAAAYAGLHILGPSGKEYKIRMPNRVVHFEIEAADRERAKNFYSQAFGWQMQQMGTEMSEYVVVMTGDPKEPGGINGGIFISPPGAAKELNAYSCVIGVDNIDQAMAKVKSAGGQLLGDKMDIPTVGTFMRCKDTEGNIFSMLQPTPGSM
jgi:predicted enzyme related to lactoylglutathione lyase